MDDSIRRFYDDFAETYHLIFADWEASIARQAAVLDRLIGDALGTGLKQILDCAAGIGTQALGLARLGHQVHASDLSPAAIERLRREAAMRGLAIETTVADLRELPIALSGRFDGVLACDNALPHLAPDQLPRGISGMAATLRPGGLFIASIRDYDALRRERPRTTPLNLIENDQGRRLTFQLLDWDASGESYQVQQFILRDHDGHWQTSTFRTTYQALRRDDLTRALTEASLIDVTWREPAASGFYQPLVTARKPDL